MSTRTNLPRAGIAVPWTEGGAAGIAAVRGVGSVATQAAFTSIATTDRRPKAVPDATLSTGRRLLANCSWPAIATTLSILLNAVEFAIRHDTRRGEHRP